MNAEITETGYAIDVPTPVCLCYSYVDESFEQFELRTSVYSRGMSITPRAMMSEASEDDMEIGEEEPISKTTTTIDPYEEF